MASKFVFPGGAVDPEDFPDTCGSPLHPDHGALAFGQEGAAPEGLPEALVTAAMRELREETGLDVKRRDGTDPGAAFRFVFRAITPPGRPRRFDARFFVADCNALDGDLDDFSSACDELSDLHWVALSDAPALDLPFITEVVLAEVSELLPDAPGEALRLPDSVPFFDNSGAPRFSLIPRAL